MKQKKIFFDMDGVLANFPAGIIRGFQNITENNNTSRRAFRRYLAYDGEDRQEINMEFLESLPAKKDTGGKLTTFEKRVRDVIFSIPGVGKDQFWLSLPLLPGALQMIEHAISLVGIENVHICSAPISDTNAEEGKKAWCETHLPVLSENVIITPHKESVPPLFPNCDCILVDDRHKYVSAWTSGGGIAIHHRPPATLERSVKSMQELSNLINVN